MCIDFNLRHAGCLHTCCDVNAPQEWCSSQGKGAAGNIERLIVELEAANESAALPSLGIKYIYPCPAPAPLPPPRLRLPDITDKLATLRPHVFLQSNVVNFFLGLDTSIWCDATSQSILKGGNGKWG